MQENQRQKQKKQTKRHIIEAALNRYAAEGLIKTPTGAIAKAAKVSHGTIFAHFSTQDELLIAVIDEFGSRINMRLHELAAGKIGVRGVLEAHLKSLTEFEGFYTRLVIENPLLPKDVRNTFIMIQSAVSFHLSQEVDREIKEGSLLPLPPHMVFNGWIGLLHYYLANNDLFAPGESVLKRYGQDLLMYYMGLITPKK